MRAEAGVGCDQGIQGLPRLLRSAQPELRLGQAEHQVRIVAIESTQGPLVMLGGLGVIAARQQRLRELATIFRSVGHIQPA